MSSALAILLLSLTSMMQLGASWRYETRCTRAALTDVAKPPKTSTLEAPSAILDDLTLEADEESPDYPTQSSSVSHLMLRCANTNDFLFVGLTQYGVFASNSSGEAECLASRASQHDCLVTVDYVASECNGLNLCRVQLDAQFLHSCKRNSDYISLAYECIPGAQRLDVCSNEETFLIDSSLNSRAGASSAPTATASATSLSRFGAFYLTSPGYPNEYANNLANCSCRMEYVRIEGSVTGSSPVAARSAEINLALSAYEFDLEDSDETAKCHKDYFSIVSDAKNETICGNHKEFREMYAQGASIKLQFHSDDFITRRGFLLKISTISASKCPTMAHERFDSSRCVSLHHERLVSWSEAARTCVSRGGRLLAVNDFVDSLRMSSLVRADESRAAVGAQFWVSLARKSPAGGRKSKCVSKSAFGWHEEKSCSVKRPYICEYDAIRQAPDSSTLSTQSGMSDTNGNRLIRVACGQSSPLSSSSSSTPTSTTKIIPSNSILNTQRPISEQAAHSTRREPAPPAAVIIDKDYDETDDDYDPEPASPPTAKPVTVSTTVPASKFTLGSLSQDYLLILAVVCGFAIVLVAINVFCIWNYYNKKLHAQYKHDLVEDAHVHHQLHPSSTLLPKPSKNTSSISSGSSAATGGGVTNRTLTSCLGGGGGGSYVRVPVYDLHASTVTDSARESTDSGISRASFKQLPVECLRALLGEKRGDLTEASALSHYYETLSRKPNNNLNNNEYHVYNPIESDKFDSMVVVPTLMMPGPGNGNGAGTTVVLLTAAGSHPVAFSTLTSASAAAQHKGSQYSSIIYGELGTSYGGSSTASSSGSTKPLLSFGHGGVSGAAGGANASSVSTEIEIDSSTASQSPQPNI